MKKLCFKCNEYAQVPRSGHVLAVGGSLLLSPIVLMVLCAVTVVGMILLPVILIFSPFLVVGGIAMIISSFFVKGTYCEKCKYVMK